MKRLFFALLIVLSIVTFTGCGSKADEYGELSKEEYLASEVVYDNQVYVPRRIFEDKKSVKDLNTLLVQIVDSQQAIMTLMDGYSVKDVTFTKPEVKEAIAMHYDTLVTALDELQYGVGNERFEMIKDAAGKMYRDVEDLKIDYTSKSSRKIFYGTMYLQNKEMKEVIALYNE